MVVQKLFAASRLQRSGARGGPGRGRGSQRRGGGITGEGKSLIEETGDAGQFSALQKFQRRAAAGGDVGHLIGKA